jgi:peptide methionine sulfoxide reductase msrA/msrB
MKDSIRIGAFIIFFGLILLHPMGLNTSMTNNESPSTNEPPSISASGIATAYFAGGCFWCMEPVFDALAGVTDTTVGYMGGKEETANYNDVSSGRTQHVEAIQVSYDPNVVSYATLLMAFWQSIDPTDPNGQFADKGPHYQTAIFIKNESNRAEVEASIQALLKKKSYDSPIVTKILLEQPFYKAEEYHQNYYKKNAVHYNAYKLGSGRSGYLQQAWGKPTDN